MKQLITTAAKMRQAERDAVRVLGIPSVLLMESAAIACVRQILLMREERRCSPLVIVGRGNNGGDGLAIARHLVAMNCPVSVALFARADDFGPDAFLQYQIARRLKIPIHFFSEKINQPRFFRLMEDSSLIVDALFGTGLSRPLQGDYLHVIRTVNRAERPVLSVDVPSGLNADSGEPMPAAIHADRTVTFGLIKKGFLAQKAKRYIGKVIVDPIGLPLSFLRRYSVF